MKPYYIPDLSVVDRQALRHQHDDYRLVPPPLLVAEIMSPESRRRDLGEKADNYLAGGAAAYWTVEVPGLADVSEPVLTVRRRRNDQWEVDAAMTGVVQLDAPFRVSLNLRELSLRTTN